MKFLPVPPLRDSLDRYLSAVAPLLSADEFAVTERVVEEYATGLGPAAQDGLMRFAEDENVAERSWLSAAWLRGYLVVRDPLPLSSSVGFRLAWPGDEGTPGLALAAEVLHGFAGCHLAYLRGEIEPELTPRGEELDTSQQAVIAGGIRHPMPECDEIRPGEWEARDREVGVLWRGRWFAVRVSDAEGALRPRAELRGVLERIFAVESPAECDVTALSYLGSAAAAAGLEQVLDDPENRRTYDRISHALFALHLDDSDLTGEDPEAEFIRRVGFDTGRAWAYKPLTYQVQLRHSLVGLHMEHSVADGATLMGLVTGAIRVRDEAGRAAEPAADVDAPEEVAWVMPPALKAEIDENLAAYRDRAAPLRTQRVRTPNPIPAGVRISGDAVLQWVMLFAQRATYGRVRSTYESVDMREYAAGRTECLRPNTPAAVGLVEALLAADSVDSLDTSLVELALDAHRGWVKAAKAGCGVDRHLLGLKLAADRLHDATPLHDDVAYARLSTDFLSTTSLGTRDAIVRAAFAPTSQGGLGCYYVVNGDELEYTVTHRSDEAERVGDFVENLVVGAQRLEVALAAWSKGSN